VRAGIGVRDQPGLGSPTEQLTSFIGDRRALLVLDNCEHLLAACARLVRTVLEGTSRLRVLATSREPLGVAGEVVYAVPPLRAPPPGEQLVADGAEGYESVALFVDRARMVSPHFELSAGDAAIVSQLCGELDGLPLAIELAAPWIRVLAPAQIQERLTRRFALLVRTTVLGSARQRSLQGCLDWSFDLCTERERLLWARLSVFVGGSELDAVETVCADERLPAGEVYEAVAGLVEKSVLTRADEGAVSRYRMLETIRAYGAEKLVEQDQPRRVRARHRDWCQHLVHEAVTHWISPRQAAWIARLDRELPNIRAALEFSLGDHDDPGSAESAVAIVGDLFPYWIVRGLQTEGRIWLERALSRPTAPSMARSKALCTGAALAGFQRDLPAAQRYVQDGLELAAQLGDRRADAIAVGVGGMVAMARGELDEAEQGWQYAADHLASEEDGEYLTWHVRALAGLAMTKGMLGDLEGAARCHERIVAICDSHEESWFSGFSLWTLGLGLWRQGDAEAAEARLREGLARVRRVNDTFATGYCVEALGWVSFDRGDPERAAILLGAAARLSKAMGTPPAVFPELSAQHERYLARVRAALGEARFAAAFGRGERMPVEEGVAHALGQSRRPSASGASPERTAKPLTRRERQVAELLAQGLSNRDISAALAISPRTVEGHVDHVLSKLGLSNRAAVADWVAAYPLSGE